MDASNEILFKIRNYDLLIFFYLDAKETKDQA
jgi:hypothetical protein